MTIGEARAATVRTLKNVSDAPDLDTDWLLLHIFQQSETVWLLMHSEDYLSAIQEIELQKLTRERTSGKPLAYILGEAWFYGRRFMVSPDVLIPRPATEALIEKSLEVIDSKFLEKDRPLVVADIGTGSGCIAIALALARPQLLIYATDKSGIAISVAEKNIIQYNLGGRIKLLRGQLCSPLLEKINLLVANLPYLPAADYLKVEAEVTRESAQALYGGEDGLDLIKELIRTCPAKLAPGGAIMLEFDPRQRQNLEKYAKQRKFKPKFHQDLSGKDRVVVLTQN